MRRLLIPTVLIAWLVTAPGGSPVGFAQDAPQADEAAKQEGDTPKEIGLLERSGRRLAQVDITVIGPREIAAHLTPDDFRLKVQYKKIPTFILDRFCEDDAAPPGPTVATRADAVPGVVSHGPDARPPASYMFYFDQVHLTLGGRQNALDVARQLVRELVHDRNQAMIVSNANQLKVAQAMTDDVDALLASLDLLEKDRTQWDTYATQEDSRVADVIETMNDADVGASSIEVAMGRARRYQLEETWRAEKSMRRLAMTLARLSDLSAPKAVLFFADTIRSNAGEHYLSFFGQRLRQSRLPLLGVSADALMAQGPFDRIVNEASAQGIRFYPVLSQGLVTAYNTALPTAGTDSVSGASPSQSNTRFFQARDTLSNLAAETGGYAFVQGQSASHIAGRIDDDFHCLYIASFDAEPFPEDAALRVVVTTPRTDIRLRTRGRLVVQSPSARTTSRLLAAFADPTSGEGNPGDPFAVRTHVIPTGFRDGKFTGLLQLSVPPSPLSSATWDLGASVIREEKVGAETSGRLSVPAPGVAVVLEEELTFKPGDYEIVAVAHETSSGLVSSEQIRVRWPDLKQHEAAISEVTLLQPADGAFLRGDETRSSGSMAHAGLGPVRTDRPTALVGLVCRNRKRRGDFAVTRRLVGEASVDFPPLEVSLQDDTCAQIRDVLPADSLGEGYYRYEIVVEADGRTLYEGSRVFLAVDPAAPPG